MTKRLHSFRQLFKELKPLPSNDEYRYVYDDLLKINNELIKELYPVSEVLDRLYSEANDLIYDVENIDVNEDEFTERYGTLYDYMYEFSGMFGDLSSYIDAILSVSNRFITKKSAFTE